MYINQNSANNWSDYQFEAWCWVLVIHPLLCSIMRCALSLSLTFPILCMRMWLLLLCASHMKESSKGCLYWCKKLWHSIECPVEWYISHGFPPPQLHVFVVECCCVMMCVPFHTLSYITTMHCPQRFSLYWAIQTLCIELLSVVNTLTAWTNSE